MSAQRLQLNKEVTPVNIAQSNLYVDVVPQKREYKSHLFEAGESI